VPSKSKKGKASKSSKRAKKDNSASLVESRRLSTTDQQQRILTELAAPQQNVVLTND
jgi:hypothetical protein